MHISIRAMNTARWRVGPVALLAAALSAGTAEAQWNSDASQNLLIADHSSDQAQPKIRATSDGGCYISWFDGIASGYDVRLQRLDPLGYEQWPHNGVLVADRSFSSTQDYDLAVDANDNAVLVYRDDRVGGTQIGVNKVSPAGVLLWGPLGVHVTATTEFVATPSLAVTSDGHYVVGWTQESDFVVQRLDAAGNLLWGPDGLRQVAPSGSYMLSDLVGSDNGSAIALWVRPIGNFLSDKHLYTQKFAPDGSPMWGLTPRIVYDGGSVQIGYFPQFVSDGAGGAVYGWYETSGARRVYVQHLNAAGVERFPHNGVPGSIGANIGLSPDLAYNAASDEIFLFWTEANSFQTMWGLYGQKFDGAGVRQWSNTGAVLIPLSANQNSFVRALTCADGAMVFCFDRSGPAQVLAMRVDGGGNFVWPASPMPACSVLSSKARLTAAMTPSGMALLGWGDGRTDGGDIYAQNINADATLGLPAQVLGDTDCDGDVDFDDIDPFVKALEGQAAYEATYPDCRWLNGDIDGDDDVDFDDIDPFVELLGG